MDINSPVASLRGVGQGYQLKLEKLGIRTIRDLFFHLPFRYDDFSRIYLIKNLIPKENATIQGKVLDIQARRSWKKGISIVSAIIEDDSGAIRAIWFNQPFVATSLIKGSRIILSGKIALSKEGIYISNPAYEEIGRKNLHTGRLIPIYPETQGVTSKRLSWLIKSNLKLLENLPEGKILEEIHFPLNPEAALKAKEKIYFNELLVFYLYILGQKKNFKTNSSPALTPNPNLIAKFIKTLGFNLTPAQSKATKEILNDLQKIQPMHRLLEGEVGSGKTVVAAISALASVLSGFPALLMAPTSILAQQHYQKFKKFFPKGRISFLTGKEKILPPQTQFFIGTQALLHARLPKMGLVIIDEQHRFGIRQRAKLSGSHLLSMTATPIPRTLALTIYSDLDISILDELPQGRKKIITKVIKPRDRNLIYSFISRQIKKDRQLFVICPLVEESLKLQSKAVLKEYEKLKTVFPKTKIDYVHGKLKEKLNIIKKFRNKKIDILVSTSLIEVGIDIPNASLMIIEGAERFGLAQLHQMRGRIGRGKHQSYCYLFADSNSSSTRKRLKAIANCSDGFKLAEADLKIRGPGQFMGLKQSGLPDVSMEALTNLKLAKKARAKARQVFPKLNKYPDIKKRLEQFERQVHWE